MRKRIAFPAKVAPDIKDFASSPLPAEIIDRPDGLCNKISALREEGHVRSERPEHGTRRHRGPAAMTGVDGPAPQALAEACAAAMWNDDSTARRLGMVLDHLAPGEATMSMQVTTEMTNGHGIAHGGYIFTLADSAFAFACNTYNQVTVAQHCSITYLVPGRVGDRLTATAREISRRGRSGLYDISVTNQDGIAVAEFRGQSRTLKDKLLPDAEA
jgi:acyl-CoA thioesterase